jgi:hypothetical protein
MEANQNNKSMDIRDLESNGWGFELGNSNQQLKKTKGIFKGKVVSTEGHRVFGVVVELIGTDKTYLTSPSGYFKITDVPEGIYLARFSFPGFKETEAVITIFGGEEIDLTMEFKAAA